MSNTYLNSFPVSVQKETCALAHQYEIIVTFGINLVLEFLMGGSYWMFNRKFVDYSLVSDAPLLIGCWKDVSSPSCGPGSYLISSGELMGPLLSRLQNNSFLVVRNGF
jgi:hypothetical protein